MGNEAKSREQLIEELNQARRLIEGLEESLRSARENLEESNERERIHSSLSNDIFFCYDNTLKVLSVTSNVERIAGYDPAELVGKKFNELELLVHPEDIDEAYDNVDHILSGKTVYAAIYRFFTKDGQKRYAEVTGVPIYKGDKVAAMVSRARDITEHVETERSLREGEARCRALLHGLPEAVGILRRDDNTLLYANERFRSMTGYATDEVSGKTLLGMILPEGAEGGEDFIQALDRAGSESRGTYRCRTKDGALLDVMVSTRPFSYEGQDCIIMVMTDVTAVKADVAGKMEDETRVDGLTKMQAIRTLASGIAQDFNNILTTILGYTKMALRDASDLTKDRADLSVVRSDLNEVRASALRARDLVNQLLAFSRHTHTKFGPVELSEMLSVSLRMLHPLVPANIELRENLKAEGLVLGDTIQIHQALMNVCTNAFSAMNEHGGVLEVTVEKVHVAEGLSAPDEDLPSGPYLKVTVSDTGSGMDSMVKERIFEPYFTTRWKGKGTGLGLSVVYGIMRNHGGTVVCTSLPGKGTSIDLYFPELTHDAGDTETLVDMANARGNETILIIDDEVTVVEQTNRTLESLGYSVVAKNSGRDALEHFRMDPLRYDLVITDLTMPDMTGRTMAQRLVEIRQDIPIIVWGQAGATPPGEDARIPGQRECIMKPVEMRGLARMVRKVLDREHHLTSED
ncbi:MAG: PAS domain S-box protein [Desulfobacterota bacterium]|nr:PAS domain S-box protein [Thermodesulfobacteriota bacterium]